MSFLHNLQLFDLEVFNQKVKDYLFGTTAFPIFLEGKFAKRDFGIKLNDMIRQRWLSQSWSDFIQWYKGGGLHFIYKKDYVYRGIRNYNFSSARRILKYGHDRRFNEEWNSDVVEIMKEKYGVDNDQWIWATRDIGWTFNYANDNFNRGQNGTRIILIYDADKLRVIKEPKFTVYFLAQGVSSFKDALFGLIRVKFV